MAISYNWKESTAFIPQWNRFLTPLLRLLNSSESL